MIWLWLAACGATTDPPTKADPPADTDPPVADTADGCSNITWATAGGPVLLTWCAPCHASGLPRAQRQGAPVGVDLDTQAGALQWADRVEAVLSGPAPTMPPAGGPTQAERARLFAWLRCEG